MKVTIKNKKFIMNDNVVICILEASMNYDWWRTNNTEDAIIQISGNKRLKINGINPANYTLCFKGIAKCNIGDTFNEITGKRLAEKKAMMKLCSYYKKFIKDCCKEAEKTLDEFKKLKDSLEEKENKVYSELTTLLMEV